MLLRSTSLLWTLLLSIVCADAAPFSVKSTAEIRADAMADWADISVLHNDPVNSGTTVATGTDFPSVQVTGLNPGSLSISNDGSLAIPGPLLAAASGSFLQLDLLSVPAQGLATTAVAFDFPASFVFRFELASGAFIERTISAETEVAVFCGLIAPADGVVGVNINCQDGSGDPLGFAIDNLLLQMELIDPLVPDSVALVEIAPVDTYLHRGLDIRSRTPGTETAVEDHDNAYDLLELFPTLKAGDILMMERQGVSLINGRVNQLLGVMMETEVLLGSEEFQRLPGALPAGTGFYSSSVENQSLGFATPTNIRQDFLITSQSSLLVPVGARYVFFSKATPDPGGAPLSVRISHIPFDSLQAWLDQFGLVGANAELDSDLDGDGLRLLEEFAFNHDPTQADRAAKSFAFAPNGFLSGDRLRLAFGARTDVPLRFFAEFSDDLQDWDRGAEINVLLLDDSGLGRAVFAVDDPNPGPSRFGRIIVEDASSESL
ncbi:MAG: hypothetical protein AAFX93_11390 [Verrucomicrobiota bacterium]